jgi:hypothetical protein
VLGWKRGTFPVLLAQGFSQRHESADGPLLTFAPGFSGDLPERFYPFKNGVGSDSRSSNRKFEWRKPLCVKIDDAVENVDRFSKAMPFHAMLPRRNDLSVLAGGQPCVDAAAEVDGQWLDLPILR